MDNKNLLENIEQTRVLAADTNTDPEVLRILEKSSDRLTREAVAANPNTPTDVLLRLGAELPEQLLNNPLFSLLLLENLNFVDEIPLSTLRSILKLKNVPQYILEQAADKADIEVQLALASNNQTSQAVLDRLTQSRHTEVVESARLHVNLAGELTEGYQEKLIEEIISIYPYNNQVDIFLAHFCSIDIFKPVANHIANQGDYNQLARIAYNPHAGEQILLNLVKIEQIKNFIASNQSTPISILKILAKDESPSIRYSVARNPNTSLRLLQDLAKDSNSQIAKLASQIYLGIKTHPKLFKLLKAQTSPISKNQNYLKKICSVYWIERLTVVYHPDVSPEMLQELAEDCNQLVRAAAKDRLQQSRHPKSNIINLCLQIIKKISALLS